ncbi:hypothetical protein C0992_008988 [Termitomyces sp. T32_za158]|nr:hypothetical protein C0992_008988 [Termitomyces sp. T32_za158]
MDSFPEPFPEKELLTKADISTDHLYDYLSGLYSQSIWVPISWTDCVLTRARGFKLSDNWQHEGVIVEFSRHGHRLYAILDREWTDAGSTADSSSAALSAHEPDSSSTASSTTTLSSDKDHSKKNVMKVISSKSLPAADRVHITQSEPSDPSWRYTFTLTFTDGLPFMIAAIAGKSITSCQPQYQVLTTNCFYFSALFHQLLRSYAVEEKLDFKEEVHQEKAEEEVVHRLTGQHGMEQESVEHQEGEKGEQGEKEKFIQYTTAGTFLGVGILGQDSLTKYVAETYSMFKEQVCRFKKQLDKLERIKEQARFGVYAEDQLRQKEQTIEELRRQLQLRDETQG